MPYSESDFSIPQVILMTFCTVLTTRVTGPPRCHMKDEGEQQHLAVLCYFHLHHRNLFSVRQDSRQEELLPLNGKHLEEVTLAIGSTVTSIHILGVLTAQ